MDGFLSTRHGHRGLSFSDYRADFAFAPRAETLGLLMRLRIIGFAVDSFIPEPPDLSPLLPPRLPPLLPPRLPPRPCIASAAASICFTFAPALNRWFGPGVFANPSFFGTSRIFPLTPLICAHAVVPVLPILKLLI
jgi:hypothetical protein